MSAQTPSLRHDRTRPMRAVARWRSIGPALLAAVTLLASSACWHDESEEQPDPQVWVVDLGPHDQNETDLRATLVGDRYQVSMRFVVFATTCAPQAYEEIIAYGGGYGHINCLANPAPDTVREVNSTWPELRVRELTATARVTIVAEYGTQVVETLESRTVGPLTMGEPVLLESVSHLFDPRARPANNNASTSTPLRLYATVSDCRLSNATPCGNNSHRYFFDPPGIGTGQQGLDPAGATLSIPDRAGGLAKLPLGSGQEGGRTNQPDPNRPIGAVPIRPVVQGLFQAGTGLGRVFFWGAEFQAPHAVDAALIEQAFGRGVNAGGLLAPRSAMRQYDSGPLGGQVWCQTLEHTLLTTQTSYGCGWVDQWTVGTISVNSYTVEGLGLTEAEAAALLVAMRADIEAVR